MLLFGTMAGTMGGVERVVHKSKSFQAAAQWDVEQQLRMTPKERWAVARKLKERVYGLQTKDVRECHRTR